MNSIFVMFLFGVSLHAQELRLNTFEYKANYDYGYFQDDDNKPVFEITHPAQPMLASAILPGLGQYLNDDIVRSILFVGIEVSTLYLYNHFETKGDNRTKDVNHFADENFSRVKYYSQLYKTHFGEDATYAKVFGDPNDFTNEEQRFQSLKTHGVWNTLRNLEKDRFDSSGYGDGVHQLPETKTQQYYEMIGKYAMFFNGWKTNGYKHFLEWQNEPPSREGRPDYIRTYYGIRDDMNDFYKNASWALRGLLMNHLASALDAYFSSKKKLKTSYSQSYIHGEWVPKLTMTYTF